jgi:hypothetical protein
MNVVAEPTEARGAGLNGPARERRRLIPRFRLRTLFVATVLMSLLLGWYGRHVYRVRQERAAAEALRQVGAGLTMPTFDYAGATLPADLYGWFPWFYVEEHTSVSLDSMDGASDADTQHLARLRGLRTIRLIGDGFTDEALRGAADARSLDYLVLEGTSITGQGLTELTGHERLRALHFGPSALPRGAHILESVDTLPNLTNVMTIGEPLTVEGMRALAKIEHLERFRAHNVPWIEPGALDELANSPRLNDLQIYTLPACVLGDPEFAALCEVETLERLALTGPQATDAGFARIADLPNLREVHVIAPNVTEAGARTLAQMKTLERVALPGSSTDATLESLSALPKLEYVYLPAGVSREAAQRFANDHPDCEVIRNDPGFPFERYSAEPAVEGEQVGGEIE